MSRHQLVLPSKIYREIVPPWNNCFTLIIFEVNCCLFFTVAQRVVQKSPVKVSGCELKISPFIVEPMVRVSGISRSISDDMLELFFESEKRSGGGDIKKIDKYPASDMVIITFDDEEGRLLAFSVKSGTLLQHNNMTMIPNS